MKRRGSETSGENQVSVNKRENLEERFEDLLQGAIKWRQSITC